VPGPKQVHWRLIRQGSNTAEKAAAALASDTLGSLDSMTCRTVGDMVAPKEEGSIHSG
jgi:hypothetical protein